MIEYASELADLCSPPEFWMNIQTGYELKRQADDKKAEIAAIPVLPAA